MKKNLRKPEVQGNFLNLTKNMYKKPTAEIICISESLDVPSTIRSKARVSTLTLFDIVLEVAGKVIW